jgi:DNA polymerase-4
VSRWIAHVDMDAFFVAVERLRRPELNGKPVIVATGTDPHARGVVMTASYEARKFGVHSALPLTIAHRRCPDAILVARDMASYRDASGCVMAILRRYSDQVEVAGLDEAYLDLSDAPLPKSCCRRIKHEIKSETGLTCSVGLAPNKLLAKIASDLDKPDGFSVLRPEDMLDAVGDRPATLIPGVGPKTAERLARIGITKIAELAQAPSDKLERALGSQHGKGLRARANGIDDRRLEMKREPKSESRETTFAHDVDDPVVLHETLQRLMDDLCERLASSGYTGRTVRLKIRLRPFRTYTRSRTIDQPTSDREVVGAIARELLDDFDIDAPVRLLGIGLDSLRRAEREPEAEPETPPETEASQAELRLEVGS